VSAMVGAMTPTSTAERELPRTGSGGSNTGLPPAEDPSPDRDRPSFSDFVPFDGKITGLTAAAIVQLGGKLPKYIDPELAFTLDEQGRRQMAMAIKAISGISVAPDDLKVEAHVPVHLSPRLSSMLGEPDRESIAEYIRDICNNAFGAPAISHTGHAMILPKLPSKTEVRVADGAWLRLSNSEGRPMDVSQKGFLIWHVNETPRELPDWI